MATPDRPPSFMDRVREAPMFLKIGLPILLVLVIVGAASSAGSDKSDTTSADNDTAASGQAENAAEVGATSETEPTPDTSSEQDVPPADNHDEQSDLEPSPGQRVRDSLGDEVDSDLAVGDSEVRSVATSGPVAIITLTTPEGGFEGASTDDTDALASAAFAKVYEDAGWQGSARVVFRGGLIDSATGREMSNAPTASYGMDSKDAKRIDWSDEEVRYSIDWSLYRELCHPALKGC